MDSWRKIMVRYLGLKFKFSCCEGIDLFFKSGVCVIDFKCKIDIVFG